jgi:hypothetical protein
VKPNTYRVNCLHREWAVIEFDEIGREYQASLVFYLAERFPRMPLCLIVDSGNKSYHGYFSVGDVTREEYFELFKLAKRLGCDSRMVFPEQRARMPNGWNHKEGAIQKVVWMSDQFRKRLEKR